jgi:hypothetical protein
VRVSTSDEVYALSDAAVVMSYETPGEKRTLNLDQLVVWIRAVGR